MSDCLRPHEPQHARPPCPSPTPRVYLNSCPLSQWFHPTISSSVVPFSSCLQPFPASGCFQMRQFFTSGGQSIGVSASTSVPPMNTQNWSPLGWTGWISLQSKGLSSLLQHHSSKASILQCLVRAGFVDYHLRVFCGFSKRFHMYDNLSQTNGGNKNGGQANRLHEWNIKSVHLALRRGRLAALGNWAGCKYHTCWH